MIWRKVEVTKNYYNKNNIRNVEKRKYLTRMWNIIEL